MNNLEINNTEAYQALLKMDQSERTFKSRKGYAGAYTWSVLIPPLGIYFFIKYVFFGNGTPEDIKAGCISLILTVISALASIWIMGMLFKQTASMLPNQGTNAIMELITPENQKKLFELYK